MLKRALLIVFGLAALAGAESTKTVYNPFTNKLDYITKIDSNTAVSVATVTASGPITSSSVTVTSLTVTATLTSGPLNVTNAPVSGTAGTASQINTGDPNTVGLIVKGNTYNPPSIQPNSLPNLLFWFKPETLSSLSDGVSVSSWTDSSGSGNHLLQANGAKQPIYKVNLINGLGGVRFDGISQFLKTAPFVSSQPLTYFLVMKINGTLSETFDGNLSDHCVFYNGNGAGGLRMYAGLTSGPQLNANIDTTNYHVYAQVWNTTTSKMYFDGTLQTANGNSVGTSDPGGFTMGSRADGGANSAEDVVEFFAYSGVVSDANIQKLESYLGNRTGIALSISTPQTSSLAQWQKSDGTIQTSISGLGFLKLPVVTPASDTAEAAGLLARDSNSVVYISTGTAAGSWSKVGAQ